MMEIASHRQLRMSLFRWAVVIVPAILLLGFLSASLAPSGNESRWYVELAKPAGTPPNWLFPVAWTIIYILSGIALAMVASARGSLWRGPGILLFVAQLVANLAWTPLFFGAHLLTWSLVLLVVILLLVIATTIVFARVRTVAAWLLLPYMIWVSYAGLVLYGIRDLNPGAETLVAPASSTQIVL